jgi:hypothetical protein
LVVMGLLMWWDVKLVWLLIFKNVTMKWLEFNVYVFFMSIYFCLCHTSAFPSANNFAHAQTLYRIGSLCRSRNIWILYGSTLNSLMDTRKSKSDVFQTAISIKHRILATFNIRKINLSDCMPLTVNNTLFLQLFWSLINLLIYLFILILLAAVH